MNSVVLKTDLKILNKRDYKVLKEDLNTGSKSALHFLQSLPREIRGQGLDTLKVKQLQRTPIFFLRIVAPEDKRHKYLCFKTK